MSNLGAQRQATDLQFSERLDYYLTKFGLIIWPTQKEKDFSGARKIGRQGV